MPAWLGLTKPNVDVERLLRHGGLGISRPDCAQERTGQPKLSLRRRHFRSRAVAKSGSVVLARWATNTFG